ncbi:hypothetical protein L7F22_034622 [Adiantum nelumboides]|nr:hypothetical protein [Adiantum nelumboides]
MSRDVIFYENASFKSATNSENTSSSTTLKIDVPSSIPEEIIEEIDEEDEEHQAALQSFNCGVAMEKLGAIWKPTNVIVPVWMSKEKIRAEDEDAVLRLVAGFVTKERKGLVFFLAIVEMLKRICLRIMVKGGYHFMIRPGHMALLEHDKETFPAVEGNSASFHDKDGADQLVYQLVRVEEDGSVVPASEDEVIEMESYLEEEAIMQVSSPRAQLEIADEEPGVCEQGNSILSKANLMGPQDLDSIDAERKRILAQLAFLDALLQKLKSEEQERVSLEATEHRASDSKATRNRSLSRQGTLTSMERWESKSETNNMSSDVSDEFGRMQVALMQQNPGATKFKSSELESPSSTSKHNWTSTSNESLYKQSSLQRGLIEDQREASRESDGDAKGTSGLDKLSVKELHEAFQTTFGHQTSNKDKQWLKQRISLGLGGSLEVSSAEDGVDENFMFPLAEGVHDCVNSRPAVDIMEPNVVVPDPESLEYGKLVVEVLPEAAASGSYLCNNSFDYRDQSPSVPDRPLTGRESESLVKRDKMQDCREEGKRKRKPTKRYIEELTAKDSRELNGKVVGAKEEKENFYITNKMDHKEHTALGISKAKFRIGHRKRCHWQNKSGSKCVTYSSSERAAKLVRKAISLRTSRLLEDANLGEPRAKIKTISTNLLDTSDSSMLCPGHEIEPLSKFSSSKVDANALLVKKSRMPKKHHHPWTLKEVMKLMEGVTHYGVGKWADIKKKSFSNCDFRSSTDLKDKWRNLVRASNTHLKMGGQVEKYRKHSVSPVPGPILIQVRELTKQSLPVNIVNGVSRSGRSVSRKQLI